MYFLYPAFLWASLFVIIPIIIHFIRFFKIKTILFPDIQLLKEIEEEKKSFKKIIQWLILLFRILFIFFLALTFAMPFKKKGTLFIAPKANEIVHVLLIDNSLSMLNENAGGNLLEQAKKWAEKIIDKLPAESKFLVAEANGKLLNSKPIGAKKCKEIIRQIQPVNFSLSTDEWIYKVFEKTSYDYHFMIYYIFSDFQKMPTSRIINNDLSSVTQFYCYPLRGNIVRNAFIDTAFISKPVIRTDEKVEMSVKISNPTPEKMENVLLRFELNNKELAVQTITLEPQSHSTYTIPVTLKESGFVSGILSLEDNGLFFDNLFYVTIGGHTSIDILIIHGHHLKDTSLIPSIYRTDSIFKVHSFSEKNIIWDRVNNASLIILNEIEHFTPGMNEMIEKSIQSGKHVVFIPKGEKEKFTSYPEVLKTQFSNIRYDTTSIEITPPDASSPYFQGVFEKDKKDWKMPFIKFKYEPVRPFVTLWKFKTGEAFFSKALNEFNKEIYFFTCPLNTSENSFLKHPSAVPFFLNLGFLSVGQKPVFYRPNKQISLFLPILKSYNQLKLSTLQEKEKKFHIIEPISEPGGMKFFPFHYIKENGTYTIWNETNKLLEFSVNAYPQESEMNFMDEATFKTLFPALKNNRILWNNSLISGDASEKSAFENITDKPLWKLMLVCSIFCIFMEILLQISYTKLA